LKGIEAEKAIILVVPLATADKRYERQAVA
jgi:hypothetical protein